MSSVKSKLTITLVLVFALAQFAIASDIGNSFGHAWAEKLGWISLSGSGAGVDYGVMVGEAALSGYAWSEKTGWINFDDTGEYYGVTNDGAGNLSGYAWSEKLGYISFDDASANNYYQATLVGDELLNVAKPGTITLRTGTTLRTDTTLRPGQLETGRSYFSGYAWSEMGGYINFDDAGDVYGAGTGYYDVPSWACGAPISDIDGNSYDTVLIGTQCWMAENLMVSKNADGSAVNGTGDADTTPPEAYGDVNWQETEGYLYNWQDAMNGSTAQGAQGICMDGWHVPTHDEWTDLERYICNAEGNANCDTVFPKDVIIMNYLGTNEGAELKAVTNVNGVATDPNGDDGYGFVSFLAGARLATGTFNNRGSNAAFWSSSESGANAWCRVLYITESRVYRGVNTKAYGFSVRCIQD